MQGAKGESELMEKTNAMRLLDSRKVAYRLHTFSAEIHSATEVAETLNLPPEQVCKTLVVMRAKGKPMLVIVAGNREIDLRLLAQSVDEKKLRMATHTEAEELTGLQVGGISALALLNKGFDIYLDKPALQLEEVVVSAGVRGANLQLRVQDLLKLTRAKAIEATAPPAK
jgi:Cys-tRNA(Pro)/Cys-tRNA(Cys) deacylase